MSKFLSYEDRLIIAQRLLTTRRAVVPAIHITRVSSAFHVRPRKYVDQDVLMNRHTNVASVPSAPYTVLILRKTSVPLRVNLPMFAMDAESFQNVHS